MSTPSTAPIPTIPQTSSGRIIIIATVKAKDEASAVRLESLIATCRDFALSSAAPTYHTYRTVRSLDKKDGITTFVIFEEWDATPDTLRTYFESDSIQEWNKALKEENLLAEPWEEPPPFYEEFIRKYFDISIIPKNTSGSTIIINAPYAWIPGHSYYVTFDSGASSGNDFCHAESAPITSPTFWVFDIWNPALSSTTTTTTTPPTTHTVTTRPISTTTPVANQTTTGIVITTTSLISTVTTSTTTTTETTSTLTTDTSTTTTASVTDMSVMTPQDFENACKETVVVGTVISMVVMLPINMIGMYALFTQMDKMFNPQRLLAEHRGRLFAKRFANK